MNCIDLKQRFGHRYRVTHDEAAKHERGGLQDRWFQIISCKFGKIYPYGGNKLAFHCQGSKMRGIIKRTFPEFVVVNWTDDEEAIFVFHVDRLPELAKYIRPRRRRKVSESDKRRLAEMSKKYSPFASIKGGTSVRNETLVGGQG